MSTWQQYRKTIIPTQLFIVVICGVAAYNGMNPGKIGLIFVGMQFGAVLGAWWGSRLHNKLTKKDQRLPLEDR